MSHTSPNPITSHSARITEAAPARPVLVVETLDHSVGSTMLFTYTYGMEAAPAGTAQFTFCAQPAPDTPQFTFCAQDAPTDAFGAETAAPVAVEGDAVVGSWR
jgi:hypothetical protein